MLLRIDHETRLTYSEPVTEIGHQGPHGPAVRTRTRPSMSYRLRTTPPAPMTSFRDGFGNRVDLFNILPPHRRTRRSPATSFVQTHRRPGRGRLEGVTLAGRDGPLDLDAAGVRPAQPTGRPTGRGSTTFVAGLPRAAGSLADAVQRCWWTPSAAGSTYEKTVTTAQHAGDRGAGPGRGVCQDFAHLLIAACRAIGLPARYVSGYVNQPGEVETHAWVPGLGRPGSAGWTSTRRTTLAGDDHVVTAVGRDYADVPPNRGVWKGDGDRDDGRDGDGSAARPIAARGRRTASATRRGSARRRRSRRARGRLPAAEPEPG